MKYIPRVFLTLAIASSAIAEQTESSEAITIEAQSIQTKTSTPRSQSVVLSDGVNWTLVPRSSVIHRGHFQAGRLEGRPVGVLCSWKQFLSLNSLWLVEMEKADFQAISDESPGPLDLDPRVIIAIEGGKPTPVTQ